MRLFGRNRHPLTHHNAHYGNYCLISGNSKMIGSALSDRRAKTSRWKTRSKEERWNVWCWRLLNADAFNTFSSRMRGRGSSTCPQLYETNQYQHIECSPLDIHDCYFTGAFSPLFFSFTAPPRPRPFCPMIERSLHTCVLLTNSGTVAKIAMWKGTERKC